jgi:uncharacterized protein (DUF58 family)
MLEFFFLLLFLFGVAVLLQLDWIYYLLYVVGGVWLFSHWWVRRSLNKISVHRRMPNKAFTGEDIRAEVVLTNKSRLPVPWLRIHENIPIDLRARESYKVALSIGSRSTARHTFTFHCHRRGYYPVGPLRLYTGDLFGFAESIWQESNPTYVTVYPQVLPLPRLGLPSQLPFGDVRSRQRIFEDPARVAGVRPYDSGDSMRRIHWRASAHENKLLVKKYQPAIALDTTVVLDLDETAYPLRERFSGSEWGVVVAASLASHLAEHRQAVGFLSNGWDPLSEHEVKSIGSQTGQGHLMAILELLARVQIRRVPPSEDGARRNGGDEPLPDFALEKWLPARAASLTWGTTLLVVTPRLSEPLLWVLHGLSRRGLTVLAIVCVQTANFEATRSRAEGLSFQAHQVVWESDLASLRQEPGVLEK